MLYGSACEWRAQCQGRGCWQGQRVSLAQGLSGKAGRPCAGPSSGRVTPASEVPRKWEKWERQVGDLRLGWVPGEGSPEVASCSENESRQPSWLCTSQAGPGRLETQGRPALHQPRYGHIFSPTESPSHPPKGCNQVFAGSQMQLLRSSTPQLPERPGSRGPSGGLIVSQSPLHPWAQPGGE